MDPAVNTPPPAAASTPPPAAPPPAASAQPSAAPPPASAALAAQEAWFNNFKNPELKSYVQERKFTDPEQLAERYSNLEKLRGVPEERLLKIPEKMEGDDARAVFERLGAPKEAKGYELPRDEKGDPKFADWAETTFHENNLTKTQAQGLAQKYDEFIKSQVQEAQTQRDAAIKASDTKLQGEWGAQYEQNLNIARQGARLLGLDPQTLDTIEALQGRESLFKSLHKIGVSVGEANFVDGGNNQPAPKLTPEQAAAELKTLISDQKFVKKVNKGDTEALAKWSELNQLAAPGEMEIHKFR